MIDEYILDAEELPEFKLYDADKIKRFANWILDTIVYYILLIAVYFLVGFTMVSSGGEVDDSSLVINLIFFGWYFAYYILSEWLLNGRTIGKYITRTRVVLDTGYPITFKDALLRTLCRIIPFEPIAFLFSDKPWHDSLSNTRVVDWPKN
jgi:uncharacterized RDD family membrane protein YckC